MLRVFGLRAFTGASGLQALSAWGSLGFRGSSQPSMAQDYTMVPEAMNPHEIGFRGLGFRV